MQTDCFPEAVNDWDKSPVRVLAEINPRYPVRKGVEYPFIEMASVGENFTGIRNIETRRMEGSGLSRFKVGDTLFAKITPCPENGKVAHVESLPAEFGIGSTEFIVLSPKEGCHPRFLYHLVCCHEVRGRAAARMEGSTGRQRVPDEIFEKRLIVPIPSPEEQAAIARILDAIDTVIERTREAVKQAREVRKSLLNNLLSHGIGKNKRVRNSELEPLAFTSTPVGRLPSDWEISSVGKEFDIQTGFTLNEGRRPRNQKRPYLRVANVQRDFLDLREVKELEAGDAEFLRRSLKVDDLLVVEGHADSMQIGRCARVTEDAAGMTFQNHLFCLRAIGKVTPYFGCLWLNSIYALKYWNARCATSSGLYTINQRMLKRLIIPIPLPKEQETITAVVTAQRAHVESLISKLDRLVSLKSSLMHDLLTGKVRTNNLILESVATS
jgi:type I restriction enzyme S subunit